VVAPADEVDLPEDAPVVAADVDRVTDREDEEEDEHPHGHEDEGVADERLADPFGSPSPAPHPFSCRCGRHPPERPRHLRGERGGASASPPSYCPAFFAADLIFASMPFTVCLPSATADSSLFAAVITSLNFDPPCHTCEYEAECVKTARPVAGFTSLLDGSASPSEVHFFIPALPVR